jgi:hypothetical protein
MMSSVFVRCSQLVFQLLAVIPRLYLFWQEKMTKQRTESKEKQCVWEMGHNAGVDYCLTLCPL